MDDKIQIGSLKGDLERSQIEYFFVCVSNLGELQLHIDSGLVDLIHEMPTVIIFDYTFCRKYINATFESINASSFGAAVEYIIVDAPNDIKIRQGFRPIGATFYDSLLSLEDLELVVH